MSKQFELYENTQDEHDKYWAVCSLGPNKVETRWGQRKNGTARLLPGSKVSNKEASKLVDSKTSKGYSFVATVTIDDNGQFSIPSQASANSAANVTEFISWEFQPPFSVSTDELTPDLEAWLTKDVAPKLDAIGANYSLQTSPLRITLDKWVLSIGQGQTFDVTKKVNSGMINLSHGIMPVLLLIGIRKRFDDAAWKNGLFIELNGDVIGDHLVKEDALIRFFGFDSVEDIRDLGVAFGVMKERVDFTKMFGQQNQVATDFF